MGALLTNLIHYLKDRQQAMRDDLRRYETGNLFQR